MLHLKFKSLTISCLIMSGISFLVYNLQGAQSEEEIQEEEQQREIEALRERFHVFYRDFLDQQTIQRLRQQAQAARDSQQNLASSAPAENVVAEIVGALGHNFSPQQLQDFLATNNMDEVINALAHLKQNYIEILPIGKLNQKSILFFIYTHVRIAYTLNILRQLYGLPSQKSPNYTAELSVSIFGTEEEAFKAMAFMLQNLNVRNLDTFLSTENEQAFVVMDTLLSGFQETEDTNFAQEYQIALYILDMPDIDAPVDKKNRTLLIHFALQGNLQKVQLLCQNGASPYKKDNTGRCAIDYARQYGHTEVEQLLHGFAHRDQEITELTKCIDTCLPTIRIPRDVVILIRDFAHANDALQELNARFEDKKSIKKYYQDEAFKSFVVLMAKQMLHAYQLTQQQ